MRVRAITPGVGKHGLVILNSKKEKQMKKTDEKFDERLRLWWNWSKHDKNSSVVPEQRHGNVGRVKR